MAEEYVDQMSTVKFIGFPGGCLEVEDEQDVMLTDKFQGCLEVAELAVVAPSLHGQVTN